MDESSRAGRKRNSSRKIVTQRRNHILAIGIDQYQSISTLFHPVRECKTIVETLIEQYDFELEPRRVLYDDEASAEAIYTELYNLDDLTENDNLILIFSGHGYYDRQRDVGYWIPVDGKKLEERSDGRIANPAVLKKYYISISDVVDNLKTVKAHHIVLIVDSCFAGTFTRINIQSVESDYNRENTPKEELPSRYVLTSGMIEKVPDKSLFAQALVKVFREYPKEKLTIHSLFSRIEEEMEGAPYSPEIASIVESRYRGGGFAFYRRKETLVSDKEVNEELLFSGSLNYLSRLETGRFKILHISDLLLPNLKSKWIDTSVLKEDEEHGLPLEKAIRRLWTDDNAHAILFGPGGAGKTVSFVRFWQKWRDQEEGPIPLFIALNEYNTYPIEKRRQYIFRYIAHNYLLGLPFTDETAQQLWRLFESKPGTTPRFIFLMDGFNEVSAENTELLKEMQELANRASAVQILVTSRQDLHIETFQFAQQYNRITFQPVQNEQIDQYLKKVGLPILPAESTFRELLSNPMMLTLFTGTSEWTKKELGSRNTFYQFKPRITSTGELLWNFVEAQLAMYADKNPEDKEGLIWKAFLLRHLLPYLGYQLVESGQFYFSTRRGNTEELNFTEKVNDAYLLFEEEKFTSIFQEFKPYEDLLQMRLSPDDSTAMEVRSRDIRIELVDRLNLIVREDKSLRFLHQNFRDFFAAIQVQHSVRTAISRNHNLLPEQRYFPTPLKESPLEFYVRQILGQVEGEHYNRTAYLEGQRRWSIDHFQSDNFLTQLLELCRGVFNPKQLGYTLWNILAIWKEQRGELSGAKLDQLNLEGLQLNGLRFSRPGLTIPFSQGLVQEECLFAQGHSNEIYSTAYSPDGQRILTGSSDKTAKVWNAQTGACLLTLKGHWEGVNSTAYSPDGQRIITGSSDKTAKVWNAQTGACLLTLKGHWEGVNSTAYSLDGQRIITGSSDKTAKVWNAQTGACLLTLKGHWEGVNSTAYSPDGQRIITGSSDKTAKVWNAQTGACLLTLKGHWGGINSTAYSPDGQRIIIGSSDRTAKVWDAKTGACLLTLEGHWDGVNITAYSPDGQRIIGGSSFDTAKVWDAKTGACLLTLVDHLDGVNSAAYSPDGQRILTGSSDKTGKVWDAKTGACLLTLEGHSNAVYSTAYSPDGQRILTGSFDKTGKVWDAKTGTCLLILEGDLARFSKMGFSPDGEYIIAGSGFTVTKVWDAKTGACLLTLEGHSNEVCSTGYSPDGQRILTGSRDKTAKVWDAKTGACLLTLEGHSKEVWSTAYSSDGEHILTGSWDKTAKVWNAQTGACFLTLEGHSNEVYSTAYSPDGQRILTGSFDKTAKVWNAQTGACLLTLKGHSNGVNSTAYSPDGQRILTGSRDKTAKVWDAKTGACLLTLEGHSNEVWSTAYSSDGEHILTGSWDKTAKVWDAKTGTCLLTLPDVSGLFIQGCDFRNLNPNSKLSEKAIALLRQYGGIFDEEDALRWEWLMEKHFGGKKF